MANDKKQSKRSSLASTFGLDFFKKFNQKSNIRKVSLPKFSYFLSNCVFMPFFSIIK